MTWMIAKIFGSLEFRAAADLRDAERETWLPLRTVEIRNRRKTTPVIKREYPDMPGYLFVRVQSEDWRDEWHVMRGARGVCGVLANNGLASTLSDGAMEIMRRRHEVPVVPVVENAFRIGEDIRIIDERSPFCGLEGEVFGNDRATVRILLDIMGRKTPVELLGEQLARVA